MSSKLDRMTTAGAATLVKRLIPDATQRDVALRALAEAVLHAQTRGDSWSVSLRHRRIGLIVGRIIVVGIEADTLAVVVDSKALEPAGRAALEAHATPKVAWQFSVIDDTAAFDVPAESIEAVWERIRPATMALIDRASQSANSYLRAHSPGVIDYLTEVTGVALAHRERTSRGSSWLFQANPARFDLAGALGALDELVWDVRQHAGRIAPGDRVFFWESGSSGGLRAIGTILNGPTPGLPNEDHAPYVVDGGNVEPLIPRVRVRIDKHLAEPVDRETARRHPSLADLSFFRAPQGTNFALSDDEGEAFAELLEGARPPRIVKIAPGEKAKYWEDCQAGGYVCVGWDEVGDLSVFEDEETFRAAFDAAFFGEGRFYQNKSTATLKARELWTLRELRPGDLVVANKGVSRVLAVGTVKDPSYSYSRERVEYRHLVHVDWDHSIAGEIPAQGAWALRTVADVPVDLFRRIRDGDFEEEADASAEDESALNETLSSFERVRSELRSQGLFYDAETLSAYLAALQTRRFVILSGISGTGKTQLALAVASVFEGRTVTDTAPDEEEEWHAITVQPYMLKYARFVVPRAVATDVEALLEKGDSGRATVNVRTPKGVQPLTLGMDPTRDVTWLHFKGPTKEWFRGAFAEGDTFLIATDEDRSELVLSHPARRAPRTKTVPTSLVVPVRPDWTDGRELLGYHNPILDRYVSKPLLELLLDARDEEAAAIREGRAPAPYFVVFDEMNLARVEHYFSDFLSALESDRPIPLHDDEAIESGESTLGRPVPRSLAVPKNVFFTGTVNVDESTYMFSPKVLDRAFTLELNHVDLVSFGAGDTGADEGALVLDQLPDRLEAAGRPSVEDWQVLGTVLGGELRNTVTDMHDLLSRVGHPFGYRVACELGRFVVVAQSQSAASAGILNAALDLGVLMKVLPKLHGTQQELGGALRQLFAFAVSRDPGEADDPARSATDPAFWTLTGQRLTPIDMEASARPRLPRCAAKLWRMNRRLEQRGFTSFIDG